jgi:hypothetical protein
MSSLEDLISEAERLEKKASTIQLSTIDGSPVGTNRSSQGISQFADEYHLWYANCLATLPDDLKERYRSAYEGHSFVCIKKIYIKQPLINTPLLADKGI